MQLKVRAHYSYALLDVTPFQQKRFNELVTLATVLNNCCIEGERLFPGFTNIVGDSWYAFFGHNPQLKAQNNPPKNHTQYNAIANLINNEEYKRWHTFTKGDELFSVLTVIGWAEQLLKYFEEPTATVNMLKDCTITVMIQQSKKEISNMRETIIAVGTMDGKKRKEIPLREQFALAEKLRNDKELQKIANLVGRFKKIALQKQKTKMKQMMNRKNMTIGQEVSRLLPIELANYIMPHSKSDFLRRFSEQQTLIFDAKGKEKKGKGPIIICMDESSSMTSMKEQSKAFCIALLMIAKKQKRDFAIIPFSTGLGEVKFFSKGQATTEELIEFSESFAGGGTNYEHPLRESLRILVKSEFNKADILFVTDGSSYLSSHFVQQFLETKKQKQFVCKAIVLTNPNLYNVVDLTVVRKFSDQVIEVGELFEAGEVFSL